MGDQLLLDSHESLSEDVPELGDKERQVGPWNLSLGVVEFYDLGDAHVTQGALGFVFGEAPELFEDVEQGVELPMPSEEVLIARSRARDRLEGRCVLGPGSEEEEQSMYDGYRDSDTQLALRWENVEGAVRLLLNGEEYDPEDFSLVDLGNQGFVLVRWAGPTKQADAGASRPGAVLIAPDRKPA